MIKYNGKRGYYMFNTTLCYIEKDGAYLMIHRIKKENDENKDKWIGIGGKLEEGESPLECVIREASEEVGLKLIDPIYRGKIHFISNKYGEEIMHLYYSREFCGNLKIECDEGVPKWVKKEDVLKLPLWEGDKLFLELLDKDTPPFNMTLKYEDEKLIYNKTEFI
jgi:8-oxo-dGTP diphosphatase